MKINYLQYLVGLMRPSGWLCSLLISVVFLMSTTLVAQQVSVQGRVTEVGDDFGLPGVNVFEKGTSNGTITDIDGNYVLSVAPDAVLVFSYIGYKKQEILINGRSTIDVGLAADIEQLEEIVVVGYGGQEKGDVTGVVAEVNAESFNKGLITSPTQLMNGKVAGVQITPNTGEPGGQIKIRVRGGTSIQASNEPLYVIDGFPINPNVHDPGGVAKGRDPRSFLIPGSIESLTVLKDASSAAIYGSRAANGVIMITTKKGEKGKPRLSYNGSLAFAELIDKPDILSTQEFRDALKDNFFRATLLSGDSDTDWFNEVTETASSQSHDLIFSGGTENSTYSLSLMRQDIKGIVKTTETTRTNMAFNFGTKLLDDALNIQLHIKNGLTEDVYANDVIRNATVFDPTQSITDSTGANGGYFEWDRDLATKNPVAQLKLPKQVGESFRTLNNLKIAYDLPFVKGLKIETHIGYDGNFGNRRLFEPRTLRQAERDLKGRYITEDFSFESGLFESFLSYEKDIDKHTLSFLGGYSYQNFIRNFTRFEVRTQSNDLFGIDGPAPLNDESDVRLVENTVENRLISFFGRVFYSFNDRYLLTATLRRDGSTRFGPANRWGIFPSFSFGWRVLDEPFAQPLKNVFSNLKLRVGYGLTGQQEGIGDFLYIPAYGLSTNRATYQFGDEFVNTLRPDGVDPNLKWEETAELNIGLEFGVFDGRVSGSFEYYNKNTSDLLLNAIFPAGQTLADRIVTNVGKVNNQGVELTLNTVVIDRDKFRWDIDVNASYNRNEIKNTTLSPDPNDGGLEVGNVEGGVGETIQRHKQGNPIFSYFVFEHKIGDDGKPINDQDNRTPLDMYVDQNNDGAITDADRIFYKQAAPDVLLGITSTTTIHNFDLSFTLRGSFGNYVYNNQAAALGAYGQLSPPSSRPQNIHRSVLETNFQNQQLLSNYFIENGSFLKLDNITLGYKFNVPGLDKLRVYLTGQNLLALTGYSGLDPEVDEGRDTSVYPRSRIFLAGLNVSF